MATWFLVVFLALYFLVYGFMTYHLVGDRGQPTWDYGTIEDVPGASPYAIYETLPHAQHVKGEKGE